MEFLRNSCLRSCLPLTTFKRRFHDLRKMSKWSLRSQELSDGYPRHTDYCLVMLVKWNFRMPASNWFLRLPPDWTLKEYRKTVGQMGHIADYDEFIDQLDRVWKRCYRALVPGGRLICVVGDVCLSRRKNDGRHTVVPLHASIQEGCRRIGFDNLAHSGCRNRQIGKHGDG